MALGAGTGSELIDRLAQITRQFPVHLIEGGLGEDDDDGWIALTARLGGTTELVGDDIFCTNPAIITRAIARGIGNSSLIKLTLRSSTGTSTSAPRSGPAIPRHDATPLPA